MINTTLEYKINDYISEKSEVIESFCHMGGKFLITSPTGSGKTYTFLNVGKKLLSEFKDQYLFIFASPTKIQTKQNGENYNAFSVVSGVHDIKSHTVNCVVYDKVKLILENKHRFNNKKIILIIDEAHELVFSKSYRRKTMENLEALSEIAFTVIHTTATPRALLYVEKYDEFVNFVKINNEKNRVSVFLDTNPAELLIKQILKIRNKTKAVVLINDKSIITYLVDICNKFIKNKKIGIFTSETKDDENFNYLIQNNKIANDLDLIFCTNILNAGINIKNENIELIYFCNTPNLNIDIVKQFIGRTRNSKTPITIIGKRLEEDKRISNMINIQDVYKKYQDDLYKRSAIVEKLFISFVETFETNNITVDFEDLEIFFKKIKFQESKDKLNECLNFTNTGVVEIDKKRLIELVIKKHDSQILQLQSSDKIKNILTEQLNAHVEIIEKDAESALAKQLTNELTEMKKSKQKETKELKEKIFNKYNEFDESQKKGFIDLLTMYIVKEDYEIIGTFKHTVSEEVANLVKDIKQHHNLLSKIAKIYFQNFQIVPNCLEVLIGNKLKEDALKVLRYSKFNETFQSVENVEQKDAIVLGQDYLTLRKLTDKFIQKTLSHKNITYIYNAITTPSRQVSNFKELNPTTLEKFLKKLFSIYNIKMYDNKFKITSLRKLKKGE